MKEIVLPKEEYEKEVDERGREVFYCTLRHVVLHTIGLDDGRKPKMTKIGGFKVYVPYRNYFNTYVGEYPWPDLEEAGYAAHRSIRKHEDCDPTTDYYLTKAGLDWLSKELGFKIIEEDELRV